MVGAVPRRTRLGLPVMPDHSTSADSGGLIRGTGGGGGRGISFLSCRGGRYLFLKQGWFGSIKAASLLLLLPTPPPPLVPPLATVHGMRKYKHEQDFLPQKIFFLSHP